MCSPWQSLSVLPDARIICAVCLEPTTREDLHVNASGQKWDLCKPCGEAERPEEAHADGNDLLTG